MWVNGLVFLWSFRSLFEALVFLQLHNFKSILEKWLLGWNDGSSGKNKTNVCKAFKSKLVIIYLYQTSLKLVKYEDAWPLISGSLGGLSLILGSRPLLLRCTALWRSWRTGRCCSSLTDWAVWKVQITSSSSEKEKWPRRGSMKNWWTNMDSTKSSWINRIHQSIATQKTLQTPANDLDQLLYI